MFIIDTIKTLVTVFKAKKFIKEHEDMRFKVKTLINKVQTSLNFLKANRDELQKRVDDTLATLEMLKGMAKK